MESLTYEGLVPRLVQAVPEIPLDADDVADNRAYLVFNDLMRFVISKLDAEQNTEVLTKIFSFIEGAAQTKDIQVEDVLQDALYQIAVAPIERTENAKMYMGRIHRSYFARWKLKSIKGSLRRTAKQPISTTPPNKALQLTAR